MVLIGAACAAGIALGGLAIVIGLRGTSTELFSGWSWRLAGRDVARRSALAVASGVLAAAVTRWPAAGLMAGGFAWAAPQMLRRARVHADAVERAEAVAAWTELLRDTLAAAAGLEEAILASAVAAPEPIRQPVTRLAGRLRRGGLVDGLQRFADELANPAADLVVAALITAARREARDLASLLGALAASTRTEANIRRRIHTSRARIRTTTRVVVGTFGLFAALLLVFGRAYLQPYSTATGQVVLVFVGALLVAAWVLLTRMARIEGPQRFLTRHLPDGRGRP